MTSDVEEINSKTIRQQQARTKLRESFLRAISELNGKSCSVLTYEKTSLNATFSGWNTESSEILVKDLQTPSNVKINSAILRTPDILAIQFDGPILLP